MRRRSISVLDNRRQLDVDRCETFEVVFVPRLVLRFVFIADIDMVYFAPALALTSGKTINNLTPYQLDNTQYRQWSRHRTTQNPWRPGVDSICSHLMQVNDWLQRELRR